MITRAQKLILAFLVIFGTSASSPLTSDGTVGEGRLTIAPGRTQIKAVGSKLIFTCTLTGPPLPSSASSAGEGFDLRWKGPDSKHIASTGGRVYTEKVDGNRLRLYITEVIEGDSGLYSCQVNVTGVLLTANSQLQLYEDIRFLDGNSSLVERRIGADVLLRCVAEGKPEPEISWRFRGRKLISDGRGAKYVYERSGLWIHNVTRDDSGSYECRAQVAAQGTLKVRRISLNVLYPPSWTAPVETPLAIKGNDVTLECLADGNPPVTYQWLEEEETSSGIQEKPIQNDDGKYEIQETLDDAFKLKIRSVEMSDQRKYICRVSNTLGTLSAVHDVKVFVAPLITAPNQLSVLEGKSIVLLCEAAGIPLPSLTWKRKVNSTTAEVLSLQSDEEISVNATNDGISRLIIRNSDKRRHGGNYTCVATNIAGFDFKDVDLIVESAPEASISDAELIGWKDESRQVTCFATGLPAPTIAWLHDGKHVGTDHVTKVVTIRDAENVTSVLKIEIIDDLDYLFGNYSCVAKNIHGHSTKIFQLRRAIPPDLPRNVTVTSATFNAISLSVETSPVSPAPGSVVVVLPLTKWILKYQKTAGAVSPEMKINLLYEEGSNIVVRNLDANTTYTMFLSAANAAGVGPSVKFQAKTLTAPGKNDVYYKFSGHEEENGEFQADDSRYAENALVAAGESMAMDKDLILERSILADWGGISIGLIVGIGVMLAILVVTVSGAIVRTQRSITARRAVMTVVKTKGKTESGGGGGGGSGPAAAGAAAAGARIKVSECRDIDSLKVETNREKTTVGPIPGDRFGTLVGSRKGVRVTQGAAGTASSAVSAAAAAAGSPVPMPRRSTGSGSASEGGGTTPRGGLQGGGGDGGGGGSSAQSQAWQRMLVKAEAEAIDAQLLQQLEAETVAGGEFPHPPLEMLLGSGRDLEGQRNAEEEEEEEEEEDAADTRGGEMSSEESMSLNSDDECFQKIPQFEGKSFLQY